MNEVKTLQETDVDNPAFSEITNKISEVIMDGKFVQKMHLKYSF